MGLAIKRDDQVMVIAGKDRGKTGKVIAILAERGRALVEKVNMVKRHSRPTQANPKGGIVEKEASIHLSNLMLYCSQCSKPVKFKVQVLKDGKKVRACKKCNEVI